MPCEFWIILCDSSSFFFVIKELRSREEELRKAANWQKEQADLLNLRAKELANRELEIVRREVMLLIQNQQANRPVPKKRRNHFVKGRTRLSGKEISTPHGKTLVNCIFVVIQKTTLSLFPSELD